MAFDLNDVVSYTTQIIKKLLKQDLTNSPPRKTIEWKDLHDTVYKLSNACLADKPNKEKLASYAGYIRKAAYFLIAQNSVSSEQHQFIELHVKNLDKVYRKIPGSTEIKLPLEINIEYRKALQDLKDYWKDNLKTDQRNHSYFCGSIDLSVPEKSQELKRLIDKIEAQNDFDGVKRILQTFYIGKHNGDSNSSFALLNTGQNVTTRILSCFSFFSYLGLQCDTINKIDALARSVGVDPNTKEQPILSINSFT